MKVCRPVNQQRVKLNTLKRGDLFSHEDALNYVYMVLLFGTDKTDGVLVFNDKLIQDRVAVLDMDSCAILYSDPQADVIKLNGTLTLSY